MWSTCVNAARRRAKPLQRPALTGVWALAGLASIANAAGLIPEPPAVAALFVAAGLVTLSLRTGRRANHAEIQAAFAAGVLHERATGDSAQFHDQLPIAAGDDAPTQVIPILARHRRPRPHPRRR